MTPTLHLGARHTLDARTPLGDYRLPAHDLLTHGVIVGMTGSGKTGLLTVIVEEALSAGVPVLLVDVKGDLANLALAFPSFEAEPMAPWVEPAPGDEDGVADPPVVAEAAEARRRGLAAWQIDEAALARYASSIHVRVITPGSETGEPLHLLSSLEQCSARWDEHLEGARSTLAAAVSLVLRLTGRDADPARSREHALLSVLAEARLSAGRTATLGELMADLVEPPIAEIGELPLDAFVSPKAARGARRGAQHPRRVAHLRAWRKGAPARRRLVDGAARRQDARDHRERRPPRRRRAQLVLGVVLEEVLALGALSAGNLRAQSALVVFDEVYGLLPPHPANPADEAARSSR
jgi:hypothetical protein